MGKELEVNIESLYIMTRIQVHIQGFVVSVRECNVKYRSLYWAIL